MSLRLYWFLPSHGDGREVARARDKRDLRREPDIEYLIQVARAAEGLGFAGVLTPTGLFCEDAWLVAAALARETDRLKFMVALRPGFLSPTLAAQMVATYQRLSGGRLQLNVVCGGDRDEQARYGDWLSHDERYARSAEFLTVLREALRGKPFDFSGQFYRVSGAMVARPPRELPEIFLGGSSGAAKEVAAEHADIYLCWGEKPAQLTEHLDLLRAAADGRGRKLQAGTRFQVIARDTSEEAWTVADRLLETMDPARIEQAQRRFARSESEGQRRMAALTGGGRAELEVYPNVWAGYALVRPGAGAALVGSHGEVADRIEEFHSLGLDHLILSGQPHIEEAYWFGEGVIPLLRERGVLAG
ncbi:LLM class flavin-dependent oxidoreductase [Amycolatopsis sp. NPDC004079]|uniref:LLM class flavin-dependent oxidoreductase n=1 Tax=Amycolatopsis sp. NPDC004079 TaxID=3154549 RepID=UPI0033A47785